METPSLTGKPVIYQVFTRLFGNTCTSCKPNGTIEENGCGKFADFTPAALHSIRQLGATHIWYTGIIAHASRTDYTAHGIPSCHPAIVKGNAGSPYAIRDYYDVDPDLATDVEKRMDEFQALVERTHRAGLGVVIDFVPNHVSRQYHSTAKPQGVSDLGEHDDPTKAFDPQNNFYYIPSTPLQGRFDMQAGASAPYSELPAKATGNDRFDPYPETNDWYETIKLNYGRDYCGCGTSFDPIPDTWEKMLHILLYWASKNIDAFRCDMAEMVPAEFWHYAIARVKQQYPRVLFIAEIYNPTAYRTYLDFGGFDYLYDKVGLYDTLRAVTCGYAPARAVTTCWQQTDGLRHRLLNFLENHDEQRIASPHFAAEAEHALPALLVSALLDQGPFMLYFGQELGEPAADAEGFSGHDGRTTIFDYWALPTLQRWQGSGHYDTRHLLPREADLRARYARVLTLLHSEAALGPQGRFYDLMYANPDGPCFDGFRTYVWLRQHGRELLLLAAHFADEARDRTEVRIPAHAFSFWQIPQLPAATATDLLTGETLALPLKPDTPLVFSLPARGGRIWKFTLPETGE